MPSNVSAARIIAVHVDVINVRSDKDFYGPTPSLAFVVAPNASTASLIQSISTWGGTDYVPSHGRPFSHEGEGQCYSFSARRLQSM